MFLLRTTLITALAIGSALAAVAARADVIAEWDMTGQPGTQASTAATGSAPDITGLDLTRGAGLLPVLGANSINSSDWTGETTDYLAVGFTVAPGSTVDLDALFVATRSSNTGPGKVGLFYSGDGFSAVLATIDQSPGTNFVSSAIDLSALPDLTGTVEFRFYSIGTTGADGRDPTAGGTFRLSNYLVGTPEASNLRFTGTLAAVPEPGTTLLVSSGLFVLGLTLRRRRT